MRPDKYRRDGGRGAKINPMRLASLVPSATEMLFALRDAEGQAGGIEVVAVTHECDYPPAAAELPHLTRTVIPPGLGAAEIDAEVKRVTKEGGALYELDEEALRAARPDLIVTQALCEVCAVAHGDVVAVAGRLPGNPPVLSQDPGTLGEVLDEIGRLGELTGTPEAAASLRDDLEARLAKVSAKVGGRPRPKVLALEWLDPPFVGGHWVPEMIALAGGDDVIGVAGERSRELTWTELLALTPDVVVAMPCGYYVEDSRRQAAEQSERLAGLGADRIYAVDAASSFSRPGPRLVEGVELLAALFHPGSCEAPPGVDAVPVDLAAAAG